MGLFTKAKLNPAIVVEGIKIEFDSKRDIWSFKLREIELMASGSPFRLPAKAELETILATVEALKPDMRLRLEKELARSQNSTICDSVSYLIDLTDFGEDRSFRVCWSGGPDWGDVGADFTITNGAIIDEEWGD